MRLFVALDIDDTIRETIAFFLEGMRESASDVRWVRPESLHVTLKFIGEKPEEQLERIQSSLRTIESEEIEMTIRGYGFFPNPRAPRVFWIGIDAGAALSKLAEKVQHELAALDIPREEHAYNPHLTLARSAGGSGSPRRRRGDKPNSNFKRLQEKLAGLPVPEFGTMTSREFCLYRSQLSPRGSTYTKLAVFPLR